MTETPANCQDCQRPYGDEHGFPDLIIPFDAWKLISPSGDDGGLLCPSCICKRLHSAGLRCEGAFMSGPVNSVDQVTMTNLRRVENIELAIAGRDNKWAGVRDLLSRPDWTPKVGDRVRFGDDSTGTIIQIDEGDVALPYKVQFNSDPHSIVWASLDEISPAKGGGAERIAELERREREDAVTIGRLNSGEELQAVLRMHNATLARAEAAEQEGARLRSPATVEVAAKAAFETRPAFQATGVNAPLWTWETADEAAKNYWRETARSVLTAALSADPAGKADGGGPTVIVSDSQHSGRAGPDGGTDWRAVADEIADRFSTWLYHPENPKRHGGWETLRRDIAEALTNASNSREATLVTDSCGCVFCDLDLSPIVSEGRAVHIVSSFARIIECTKPE